MDEKDELEKIVEDFDTLSIKKDTDSSDIEEDADPNQGEDDIPETQSERLERLYRQGELTNQEFKLLQTELIENSNSPSESSATSGSQDRNPVDWLPEKTVTEIIELYREANKDHDPYSDAPEIETFNLQIAALPSGASVSIKCFTTPCASMMFTEREQEERFRKFVAQNPPYEIAADLTPSKPMMMVKFNVIPDGYDGELSDEDIITEINHLFRMISHTYGMSISDLSAGTVTAEAEN